MRLDAYGLLVLDNGDAGDCPRSEWSYFIATGDPSINAYYTLFNADHTWLYRHPAVTSWECSRDQTLHAFTYLASFRTNAFQRFFMAHLKRGLRCQNGDLLWANINVITRALNRFYLYPITVFFDISLILGVMERCHWLPRWDQDNKKLVWRNDPDDVGDDLNLQMSLLQANHPSPVRAFARWLYKHYRPKTYGNDMPGCLNTAHGAWLWYYRKEQQNPLNLAQLYANLCKKWL